MGRPRKNAVVEGSEVVDPFADAPPDNLEVIAPPVVDHEEIIVPEDTLSPPTVEVPTPVMEGVVKVRCIAHNSPWTDKKPLEYGEEAEVTAEIAEIMRSRHQVEIIG